MFVCQTLTFEIFAHPLYLEEIQVEFVYEGQRVKVKVKVTGAEMV